MGWATFWSLFSQSHLVTLPLTLGGGGVWGVKANTLLPSEIELRGFALRHF
jgi:hypothetical protein